MLIPVPEDNERQVVCSIALNSGITSQQLHEGDTTVTTALGNGNIGLYLKDSRVLNVTRKLKHSNISQDFHARTVCKLLLLYFLQMHRLLTSTWVHHSMRIICSRDPMSIWSAMCGRIQRSLGLSGITM